MSHYEIQYAGLNALEAHSAAIKDLKEFWGNELFDKLVAEFHKSPVLLSLKDCQHLLAIGGVQGYPVHAFYNHCYPL